MRRSTSSRDYQSTKSFILWMMSILMTIKKFGICISKPTPSSSTGRPAPKPRIQRRRGSSPTNISHQFDRNYFIWFFCSTIKVTNAILFLCRIIHCALSHGLTGKFRRSILAQCFSFSKRVASLYQLKPVELNERHTCLILVNGLTWQHQNLRIHGLL